VGIKKPTPSWRDRLLLLLQAGDALFVAIFAVSFCKSASLAKLAAVRVRAGFADAFFVFFKVLFLPVHFVASLFDILSGCCLSLKKSRELLHGILEIIYFALFIGLSANSGFSKFDYHQDNVTTKRALGQIPEKYLY
jgi:hypothetical protein